MKLYLIRPRGFCAGVVRAIDTVEKALEKWGAPIYVKHEIVHNRHVVQSLKEKGAIFVEDLKDVPKGGRVIYSAHGVPPSVREEAKKRNLFEIDATCGLVNRVHTAARRFAEEGYQIILIGHRNHVEIIGTKGEAPNATTVIEKVEDVKNLPFSKDTKMIYLTQTTLSLDDVEAITSELKKRYPKIESLPSSSICYATMNRQRGLKSIAKDVDVIFVIGDVKSSNSNRLKEVALNQNVLSHLINSEQEIQNKWLKDVKAIGMTAGASTPEYIVQRCIETLKTMGVSVVEEIVYKDENVHFALPEPLEEKVCAYT